MPSSYSSSLRIELVADSEQAGIWGQTTNRNFTQVFEEAMTQTAEVDVTAGDVTLTAVNGATDQARRPFIRVIGAPVVARQVNVPDVTKLYIVQNTTGQNLTIKPSGQTGVTLLAGQVGYVRCRLGLSAQLIEFLSTTSGNLVIPGTLTVGGTTTLNGATQINNTLGVTGATTFGSTTVHTGVATFNGAVNINNALTITTPAALNLRSGSAGQPLTVSTGRTAAEGYWGVSAGASQFTNGDVAGDMTLRAEQRLWLSIATQAYLRMQPGTGVTSIVSFHSQGDVVVPTVTGVTSGVGAGQAETLWYTSGAAANNRYWDVLATTAGDLSFRFINDAFNQAPAWLTARRVGSTSATVYFPGATTGNYRTLIGDYVGSLIARATIGATMVAGGADGLSIVKSDDSLSVQLLLTGTGYSYAGVGANQGWLYARGAMDLNIGPDGNAAVALVANGARQLITNSTGTGIGTAPLEKLDVFGNTILARDGVYQGYFGKGSGLVTGAGTADLGIRSNNGSVVFSASGTGVLHFVMDPQGRFSGRLLHNNASGIAGTAAQYIGSGTYTPTTVTSANVSGLAYTTSFYTRVGNVVTVSGRFTGTSSGAGAVNVTISLPIASTFTTTNDAGGAGGTNFAASPSIVVAATVGPSGIAFNFNVAGAAAFTASFTAQYEVK